MSEAPPKVRRKLRDLDACLGILHRISPAHVESFVQEFALVARGCCATNSGAHAAGVDTNVISESGVGSRPTSTRRWSAWTARASAASVRRTHATREDIDDLLRVSVGELTARSAEARLHDLSQHVAMQAAISSDDMECTVEVLGHALRIIGFVARSGSRGVEASVAEFAVRHGQGELGMDGGCEMNGAGRPVGLGARGLGWAGT